MVDKVGLTYLDISNPSNPIMKISSGTFRPQSKIAFMVVIATISEVIKKAVHAFIFLKLLFIYL